MPKDTGVRLPLELKRRYEELPENWLNFADFVREAVRLYLRECELRAARQIEEREGPSQD